MTPFRKSALQLFLCCMLVFTVVFFSNLAISNDALAWNDTLQKPSWNPPSWVFAPVWTLLYFLMSLSAWLIYRTQAIASLKRRAALLFFSQLLLNGLWPLIFFGYHAPGIAVVELGLLVTLIFATTITFFKIRPMAGMLFIPYAAWSIFALILNTAIWWLN